MDTKFWGPSGWKFLHLVAYTYPNNPTENNKITYKKFYDSLDTILRCKYCRQSLQLFYKQLPIDEYLYNKELLTEWIYLIHNKVNNKLRNQGLLKTSNPQKKEIDKIYKNILKNNKCEYEYLGWEFFYSITFNYPKLIKDTTTEKKLNMIQFFDSLNDVIVCTKFKKCYKQYYKSNPIKNHLKNRGTVTKWLYNLHCIIDKNLKLDNYYNLCKKYKKVMVKTCKKKTCLLNNKSKSSKKSKKI